MKKISTTVNLTGFSIIELLVVVSIVGILCGVAFVNFSRSWSGEKLLSTTRDLENWLNTQRRESIKNSLTSTITFDPQDKQFASSSGNIFDLRKSFGNGNKSLSLTIQNVEPSSEVGVVKFSFRGLSQGLLPPADDILESTVGTLELGVRFDGLSTERCIRIISPIGMIRDGTKSEGDSSCRYQSSY